VWSSSVDPLWIKHWQDETFWSGQDQAVTQCKPKLYADFPNMRKVTEDYSAINVFSPG
jgi:hypothetical protein